MWKDEFRSAFRALWAHRLFTLASMITLAVGIGATTFMLTVVDQVLLKPLPFPDAGRLVSFRAYYARQAMSGAISPPSFSDFRSKLKSFELVSATTPWNANLTGTGRPERIQALKVSPEFFRVIGIAPATGRGFLPEEEHPGKDTVAVISEALWKSHFNSDPALVGRTILLNDQRYTIVGIMPPGFRWGRSYGNDTTADLWAPFAISPEILGADQRGNEYLDVLGRLSPHTTLQAAQSEIDALCRSLHALYPDQYNTSIGWTMNLRPLKEDIVREKRPVLILLLAAVAVTLLIACNNIAGLILLRGAERNREISLRSALGASRGQLMQQILLECLLLAAGGGIAGAVLAFWSIHLLRSTQTDIFPRLNGLSADLHFLAFAAGITLLAAVVFSFLPALRISSATSYDSLKSGSRSSTHGRSHHSTVRILVVSQIALSLVLLVGAGLLVRSFLNVIQIDPGFRSQGVLTLAVPLSPTRYPVPSRSDYFTRMMREITTLPGVQSAAAISQLPMSGDQNSSTFYVEGIPQVPGEESPNGENWIATPDYFRTLGIPLLQGRFFTAGDTADSKPVVIIDEVLARKCWPGQNPLGKRLDYEGDDSKHQWREVVGVVGHIKHRALTDISRAELYSPYSQFPIRNMSLVIRTTQDPLNLASSVLRAVSTVDSEQPVYRVQTLDQLVSDSLQQLRIVSGTMTGFAFFTLFLSALGLFGVLSSSVAERTVEIGIRRTLGASGSNIAGMILRRTLAMAVAGIAAGTAAAAACSRLLASLLFRLQPLDPWTFLVVAGIVLSVTLAAGAWPLRRAVTIEPLSAIRYE